MKERRKKFFIKSVILSHFMYQQKEPETKRQKQATLTVKYPVKGIEDFLAKVCVEALKTDKIRRLEFVKERLSRCVEKLCWNCESSYLYVKGECQTCLCPTVCDTCKYFPVCSICKKETCQRCFLRFRNSNFKSTKAYQRLDVRQKDDMDNICLRCIYERKLFCPTCVLCDRKSVYESVFCPIDNHVGKKDELFWFDKADSPNSEYLEYGCYSGSSSREIGDKIVRNQIFY